MGEHLSKLIKEEVDRNLSCQKLAQLVGVSAGTIWKHTNKLAKPTVETYAKYAEYFGMPLRQLVEMDTAAENKPDSPEWIHLAKDEETLVSRYREIKKFKQGALVLDYEKFLLDRFYQKQKDKVSKQEQG